MVIGVLVVLWLIGTLMGSGDSSTTIDPSDQNDACHREALAWANNNVDGFEWNVSGMDEYSSEYDSCMELQDTVGG